MSSSSRMIRRSRSRLGGFRRTGLEGRLVAAGAGERTTTLRVAFTGLALAVARARAAFLARLHREKHVEKWLARIIRERVEIEEDAFAEIKCSVAANEIS